MLYDWYFQITARWQYLPLFHDVAGCGFPRSAPPGIVSSAAHAAVFKMSEPKHAYMTD